MTTTVNVILNNITLETDWNNGLLHFKAVDNVIIEPFTLKKIQTQMIFIDNFASLHINQYIQYPIEKILPNDQCDTLFVYKQLFIEIAIQNSTQFQLIINKDTLVYCINLDL